MQLKVTIWNLEHSGRLIDPNPTVQNLDRRDRVRRTIDSIAPDILCLVEGPKGEQAISSFCLDVLGGHYSPVLLKQPGDILGYRDSEYQIAGTQWIWFLIRNSIAQNCRLQSPEVWQSFVNAKTWDVHHWGREDTSRHSHYRHPQVMIYRFDNGLEVELIGVHLKSKINKEKILWDESNNLHGNYLAMALETRVKLATEARNIRQYIDAKFSQLAKPGIMLMGDCNDGPGQDYFENLCLFFDLIGNLQGDVLLAEKFFNHALFDYDADLRWTAKYRDEILKIPESRNPLLLDHILMSQPLCSDNFPLCVNEHAGRVEHEAFERENAGSNSKTRTSDHRPVSCVLT